MARARPPAGGLGWLFTTRIRRSSACGFSALLSYPPADFEIAAGGRWGRSGSTQSLSSLFPAFSRQKLGHDRHANGCHRHCRRNS